MSKIVRVGGSGRSSISGLKATVFGATGAVGRYVINQLGQKGTRCMIPCRDPDYYFRHLKLMGDLGVITPQYMDVRNKDDIARAVEGSNVVLNLIGKHVPTNNFSFQNVHVDAARSIAEASKAAGVERFFHVSALGAAADSESEFYKSKAEGEAAVTDIYSDACIFRPAQALGIEARFFNDLADRARTEPIMRMPEGSMDTQMQPIYINDIGKGISNAIHADWDSVKGRTFELAGPDVFTYKELVEMTVSMCQRDTPLVEMTGPFGAFGIANNIITKVFSQLPDKFRMDSEDGARQTQIDAVKSPDTPGLSELGVDATPIKDELFTVLHRHRADQSFLTAH